MKTKNMDYCFNCNRETEYEVKSKKRTITVRGITFAYTEQMAICSVCGEEMDVPAIDDENVLAREKAYRAAACIISREEIETIMEKYHISAEALGAILGFGRATIARYKSGKTPSRDNSEKLLSVLRSPQKMSEYLEEGKEQIVPVAYSKCREAVDRLLPIYSSEKINLVTRYLLTKSNDITLLALQKILYYSQGFFYALFGRDLFTEPCQAWMYGPVYPVIYHQFKGSGNSPIDRPVEELGVGLEAITEEERNFLNAIVGSFGKCSGYVLRDMTHREAPWLEARGETPESERSQREISQDTIHEFFCGVVKDYQIHTPEEMIKYIISMPEFQVKNRK